MGVIRTLNGLKFNCFTLKFEYLLIANLWVGVPERTVVLQGASDFNVSLCVKLHLLLFGIAKQHLQKLPGMNYRRIKQKSLITTLLRQVDERGWGGSSEDALALGRALLHPSPCHREGGRGVGTAPSFAQGDVLVNATREGRGFFLSDLGESVLPVMDSHCDRL